MKQDIQSQMTTAFVAAQLELENPKYDCTNPHFRSKYASLAASRKAVIPTFAKHGISITQNVTTTALGATCVTTYRHVCGESLEFGPLFIPCAKSDAWGLGSCISYVLRYSLNSSAGISGEPDDDGEAAVGQTRSATPQQAAKPIFKAVETEPTNAMTLAKAIAQKLAGSGLLSGHIRSFLESKNAWPKGCQSVPNLPEKVMARLLDESVWAEVVAFKVELMEVSP